MDKIINLLKKFNFTESESKVYIALLKNGPGTGYEISKNSSVPRSKVYNVIEILMGKGCVVVSKENPPLKYSAVPIDEFIDNIRDNVHKDLEEVKEELVSYNTTMDLESMWHIKGYDNIFNKCRHLLKGAKKEVFLQVWKEDIHNLYEELKLIEETLDKVIIIFYSLDGNYEVGLKNYYNHGFEKAKLKESGGRWISIVVDSNEVIFGHIQNEKNAEVVWTKSTPMVFLAKENIIHDAYCLKMIEIFGEAAKDKFGEELQGVREVFKAFNHS